MSLTFDSNEARKADRSSSIIRETGRYIGTITRAEKLVSRNKVHGVGLSFKTDDGATASYLDVYTMKADGEKLWGHSLIQALMGCLKLKSADEGQIKFEKWDGEVREMVPTTATGYPALMGKRIGFVLQRELGTNPNNGADTDKVILVRVFNAENGMTSTEMADGKTKAEAIDQFLKTLPPVRDNRAKKSAPAPTPVAAGGGDFDEDISF